jgi:S-adenosylmethionine hydrolase
MLITLTTDFGYRDPFVGIMKGVIAGINANARVIDLSHDIPPQDIIAGALMLRHSVPYFPRGTIHVAVIDPGVGSARRPLLVECDGNYFVGPDNGVCPRCGRPPASFTCQYRHLQLRRDFCGRDIFAPAAAYSLGRRRYSTRGPFSATQRSRLCARRGGSAVDTPIDSFGNCLNI